MEGKILSCVGLAWAFKNENNPGCQKLRWDLQAG
jgi:hypothetical protein